jgi:8-oxo-dGTP pyrophosphatase MutT (NUDIX family)
MGTMVEGVGQRTAGDQPATGEPMVQGLPLACSYCGHTEFDGPNDTGRGANATCSNCGGTMTSNGGHWMPELIGDPSNHPSPAVDPRSGAGFGQNYLVHPEGFEMMPPREAFSVFEMTASGESAEFHFQHEEVDTGGTKFPRRVDITAHHPETGDEAGRARYYPPKRKGGPISIDEVRGHVPGAASALLNEIESRHPTSSTKFLYEVKRNNNDPDKTGHSHERAGNPSDWDTHYPNLSPTIYRGASIRLPDRSARVVNSSRPKEDHLSELHDAIPQDSALGPHWTESEQAARQFAHNAVSDHRTDIPVVLHAKTPERKDIETREQQLYRGGVFPYGDPHSKENEVPVRKGRKISVTGISWKPDAPHPDADESGWIHHIYSGHDQRHHTAAHDAIPSGKPPVDWDTVGSVYPHLYGDPEVHGDAADGSDGPGIGSAVNHLAHDRPDDPGAESSSEHELEFHPFKSVPTEHIDYVRHPPSDQRVARAIEGYKSDPDRVPPLVLVHRHGVYHVADGHHRAAAAAYARVQPRALVAFSPHPDEPFSDGTSGPSHGAEPIGEERRSASHHETNAVLRVRADGSEQEYRMQHQAPDSDYGAPLHDVEGIMPDFYTHPHYYDHGQEHLHESTSVIHGARGKPDKKVRIYRALPAEHAGKGFNTGDWVSTSKSYARQHAKITSDPKHDWPVISTTVPAKHLHTEGDVHEWAYNGPKKEWATVSFKGGYHQEVRHREDGTITPVTRRPKKSDDDPLKGFSIQHHESDVGTDTHAHHVFAYDAEENYAGQAHARHGEEPHETHVVPEHEGGPLIDRMHQLIRERQGRRTAAVDWCAHRHLGSCYWPGDHPVPGQIPQRRGACNWIEAWQQQACPMSDPGPMAGMFVKGSTGPTRDAALVTLARGTGDPLLPVKLAGYKGYVEAYPGYHETMEEIDRQTGEPEPNVNPAHEKDVAPVASHTPMTNFIADHFDNHDLWDQHGDVGPVDLTHGVYATQPYVVKRHLARYIQNPHDSVNYAKNHDVSQDPFHGNHMPMFVRHDGNLFAAEGHHRTAAALQRGDSSIHGIVYDADKHGWPENDVNTFESPHMRLHHYASRRKGRPADCDYEHLGESDALMHALSHHDDGVCTATERRRAQDQRVEGPDGFPHESTLQDPEVRLQFTATWADVRNKAKRIRSEGGVRILMASSEGVVGEVRGDTAIYETQLTYVPGSARVGYWNCFLPDAPVTMADGTERAISKVEPGDEVITHTGAVRRVVRVEAKPYEGDLTRIKMAGDHRELIATSEHEVYAANRDFYLNGSKRDVLFAHTGSTTPRLNPRRGWMGIGTLGMGDYVSRTPLEDSAPLSIRVPRPPLRPVTAASGVRGVSLHHNRTTDMRYWVFKVTEGGRAAAPRTSYFKTRDEAVAASNSYYAERAYLDVKIDEELAYWLGWYTAEGFLVRKGYRVGFSLSADEVWVAEALDDIAWRKFGVRGKLRHLGNKLDYRVSHFALHHLAAQLVGHGAKYKSLSANLLRLPPGEAERFIQGWMLGDGSVEETGRHNIATVSPSLVLQARELLTRQGFSVSISRTETNPGGMASTRNGGEIFFVRWQSRRGNIRQFHKDGLVWHRVESTTIENYVGDVWDIEVEGDHSFRAYGYNVHNCGCAWSAYAWGRSPQYKRFEGRMCSHALAMQYEAQSRSAHGREVGLDADRPDWLKQRIPVVVQHQRDRKLDRTRRAVPPGNMRSVFSVWEVPIGGSQHSAAWMTPTDGTRNLLNSLGMMHCGECHGPVLPANGPSCPHCGSTVVGPQADELADRVTHAWNAHREAAADDFNHVELQRIVDKAQDEYVQKHQDDNVLAENYEPLKKSDVPSEHHSGWAFSRNVDSAPPIANAFAELFGPQKETQHEPPVSVTQYKHPVNREPLHLDEHGNSWRRHYEWTRPDATVPEFKGWSGPHSAAETLQTHPTWSQSFDEQGNRRHHMRSHQERLEMTKTAPTDSHRDVVLKRNRALNDAGWNVIGVSLRPADGAVEGRTGSMVGGPTQATSATSYYHATPHDLDDESQVLPPSHTGAEPNFDADEPDQDRVFMTRSLAGAHEWGRQLAGGDGYRIYRVHPAHEPDEDDTDLYSTDGSVRRGERVHPAPRTAVRRLIASAVCPECHGQVAPTAETCPHCGAELAPTDAPDTHLGAKKEPGLPGVAGVVLKALDTGRILMLQRGLEDEKDPARGTWEFPGGHVEDGDVTTLHAAIREWEEEVGQLFPEGGAVLHSWVSPSGVYAGYVVAIPEERSVVMKDGRVVPNPDDPKGDFHEQAAWWTIEHAKKNPALRPECRTGTPWKEIERAGKGIKAARNVSVMVHKGEGIPGRGEIVLDCWWPLTAGSNAGSPLLDTGLITGLPADPPAHSNTQNPASTGFATSEDPDDWAEPRSTREDLRVGMFHDEPEPALPSTDGEREVPLPAGTPMPTTDQETLPHGYDDLIEFREDHPELDFSSESAPTLQVGSKTSTLVTSSGDVASTIAQFQCTAGAQALMTGSPKEDTLDIAAAARMHLAQTGGAGARKTALKDFSHQEQQELINEGVNGVTARNLPDLQIDGTHYSALEAALREQEEVGLQASDIFVL